MMIPPKNQSSQLVMDQMDQRVSTALLRSKRCAQETNNQNSKTVKNKTASSGHFALKTLVWLQELIAMLQVFQHSSKPDTDIITKNITLTEPEMKMMIPPKNQSSQLVMDQMDQRVSTALLRSKRCAQETKHQNSKTAKNKTASSGHSALKTQVWQLVLTASKLVFQLLPKRDIDSVMKMMIPLKNQSSQLVMDQMDQRVSTALLRSKRCAQETNNQNSKTVKNKTASSGHFALKTLVWLLVLIASKLVFQLSIKKQVDLLLHNILLDIDTITNNTIEVKVMMKIQKKLLH